VFILPPRTSWLYRFGISVSPMRRYLVTFLFIALCIAVWFHYSYEPLNNRIQAGQEYIKTHRAGSVDDIKERIAALRTELSTQSNAPSHDEQLNAVLGYLDQAGMVLEQCAVQDGALSMQALGTYPHILNFFNHMAASGQRFLPRDVRITRGADNQYALSVIIETT